MQRTLFVPLFALGLFVLLIFVGTRQGAIPLSTDPFAIYQTKVKNHSSPSFHFKNQSDLLGSQLEFREDKRVNYVAVGDFDNDGFEDIVLVEAHKLPKKEAFIKILRNVDGKTFRDVTSEVLKLPIGDEAPHFISAAAFVDLDNDGWKDLYIAQFMAPHLVLKNIHGKFDFDHQIPIDRIVAPTRGINFFDFNRDGFLDVLITNFSSQVYSPEFNYPKGTITSNYSLREERGEGNILLANRAGKKLEITPDALGLSDHGYTWASAIADIDGDGYPDVYFANDYGFDRFYKNNQGKNFTDISKQALGNRRSENAMGAEVGDIANNGMSSIYTSNGSKPGLIRGWNHLWSQQLAGGLDMKDTSADLGIDKCGFSWGSKFADFDKDGSLDLFVVNGRSGTPGNNRNRWYYRLYNWTVPAQIKFSKYVEIPWRVNGQEYDFAQGQLNCVFWQQGGTFIDVAEEVGITDTENGRGLAVFDFNNDGQEDLLIGNWQNDPLLYVGERHNQNHWLGLRLVGTKSNRDAIGSKIILKTRKMTQTRIIAPGNGFANFSSTRVIFGIAEGDSIEEINIIWPNGGSQKFIPTSLDKYETIYEN